MAKRKYVKENNLVKAINTDSLELQKPLVNEYYDINVHNSNMDKIDTGYKRNKNDILNINNELSKNENTKYTTENGIKEFECKDGYADNIVIEGLTKILNGNNEEVEVGTVGAKLVSVGQGDKIEVLTINGSKYDLSGATYATGFLNSDGGLNPQDKHKVIEQYLEVEEGKTYVLENIAQATCYYDVNKNLVHYNIEALICNSPYPQHIQDVHNVYYAIVKIPKGVKYIRVSTGINSVGKINIYKDGKCDHKQISTTLRSLPNGVKDTIEKRGNKYVKVQRCGEVILNGNETVTIHTTTDVPVFNISVDLGSSLIEIISDKYKTVSSSGKEEGILYDYSNKRFRISTSKFNDIDAFVTDLKSSPITVVYELATPQIIELPNFNPQTYEDNTTLLLNTGVIQGECEFEVTNSMGSEIEVLKDKVSNIEEFMTSNKYNYQKHKLTQDNGFTTNISGKNLNTILTTMIASGNNMVNAPTSDWYYFEILAHSSNSTMQIATRVATTLSDESGRRYIRTTENGGTTWSTWKEFTTTSTIALEEQVLALQEENKALKEELTQIQTSIASLTSLIATTLEEK